MSDYQQRQEDRRARLQDAAVNAEQASTQAFKAAQGMGAAIPMGQPILVGHHSEGRDRRYRARMSGKYEHSFALMKKAEHLRMKAASVGTGGISADDPEAVGKLREQLAKAEEQQTTMKKINVCVRKNDKAGLVALGYTEEQAAKFFEKDFAGRIGIPSYMLSNNNANIRRLRARIAELEKHDKRQNVEILRPNYTYRQDTDENRCMFIFSGKPAENVRSLLKSYAFKWSPSRSAWVRQWTGNAQYASRCVMEELDAQI